MKLIRALVLLSFMAAPAWAQLSIKVPAEPAAATPWVGCDYLASGAVQGGVGTASSRCWASALDFLTKMGISGQNLPNGVYYTSTTGSASTTSATEVNLAALRIPANTLGANGEAEISCLWTYTSSANAKSLILRYNATSGATSGGSMASSPAPTTTTSAQTLVKIRGDNSISGQVAFNSTQTSPYVLNSVALVTNTIDTTADSYVNINGSVAGGETLTLRHCSLKVFHN